MSADRDLLFGLLALQNGIINKQQLVVAFGIWMGDRSKPLDEILVQQQSLKPDDRAIFSRLVDLHIASRNGDIAASLRSISSVGSVREDLEKIADNEIQASIAKLNPISPETIVPSVGQSTSAGQRFQIRRPLDRGGLGIVSVAVDKELNREVALKEIRDDRADDQAYRSKFMLEAEVTGGLEHPGIVPVYGLGTGPDGRPYYAMRLIRGDNLHVHIKRFHQDVDAGKEPFDGPSLRKLLRRFLDVCQAIDYAHSRGVLHRDLKPGNVMLGKYGETLVVDWGLAKPLGAKSRESSIGDLDSETSLIPSGSNDGMTIQGSIVGTAAYAPPEQLMGNLELVNERSDVYGLGAMLYELLTGKPPAQAETLEAVIKAVVEATIPSPRSIQSQIPKPLEAICKRAISRQPDSRYATAAELGQEIERWLDDLPVNAFPEPFSIRTKRWIRSHQTLVASATATVLISILGMGLVTWITIRSNATLDQKNAELVQANVQKEKERSKAAAQEQIAATSLRDLSKQAKQASKVLFDYGQTEFAAGRFNSATDKLERAWRLRSEEDPLKRTYALWLVNRKSFDNHSIAQLHHGGRVTSVAFSPDGTRVVTGSEDQTARLWDASSGAPIGEPMLHEGHVTFVAFSPDGTRLATGSRDNTARPWDASRGTARLWDASSGASIGEPMLHDSYVTSIAFSPDGTRLSTGSYDHTARLWDTSSGAPIGEPMLHDSYVTSVAFSPDGTRLATGSADAIARLWGVPNGAPIGVPIVHVVYSIFVEASFFSVAFSPDGTRVATGSGDEIARLWDASSGASIGEPMLHEAFVYSVAFSPDGTRVATGSRDKTARLWDASSGASIGEPMLHEAFVYSVAFSPDGTCLATRSADNTARLWDSTSGAPIGDSMRHEGHVNSVVFSPDGTRVATGSDDNTARLWDVSSGAFIGVPMQHNLSVDAVALSPDGTRVATASMSTARLWDASSGKPIGETMRHKGSVNSMAFSPDGTRLATGTWWGKAVCLWDAASGTLIGEPMRHDFSHTSVIAFRPDGTRLATISMDSTARLWDASSGAPIGEPMQHGGLVHSLAFSPDGTRLATWSFDKAARLWDSLSGAPIDEPMRFDGDINSVDFSPDRTRLAIGYEDNTARLWDVSSGASISEPMRHEGPVKSVGFSPDGTRLVTVSLDNNARLWDAFSGAPIGESMQHEDSVTSFAFSSDGTRLVTVSLDNNARLWDAFSGAPIGESMQHEDSVTSFAFSSDGTRLVTGSLDNNARLWDAFSGAPLGESMRHEDSVTSCAFSPDGTHVVTGSKDNTARLWHAQTVLPNSIDAFLNRFAKVYDPSIPRDREYESAVEAMQTRRLLAYRKATVARAVEEKNWFSAAFHLPTLIKAEPEQLEWKVMWEQSQLNMKAEKGGWKQAFEHAQGRLELEPSAAAFDDCLLCSLGTNDSVKPSSIANQYLRFAEASDDPTVWDRIAWISNLSNSESLPWEGMNRFAAKAVESNPTSVDYRETWGGTLYRLKRFDEAKTQLTRSLELATEKASQEQKRSLEAQTAFDASSDPANAKPDELKTEDAKQDKANLDKANLDDAKLADAIPVDAPTEAPVVGTFYVHAFLAMTYHRLNESEKSKEHRLILKRIETEQPATDWQERLRRKLLGDEVERTCGTLE